MAEFLGSPKVQYFNTSTGQPMSGGKLYSYDTGTTTPRATYPSLADATAATNANTNPIILNSRGEATVVVSGPTDFKLTDSSDNLIWTVGPIGSAGVDVYDSNGNLACKYTATASAVNYIEVTNAATGTAPSIKAAGSDSNINLDIDSKGTGIIRFLARIAIQSITSLKYLTLKIPDSAAADYAITLPGTIASAARRAVVDDGTGAWGYSLMQLPTAVGAANKAVIDNGSGVWTYSTVTLPSADSSAGAVYITNGAGTGSFSPILPPGMVMWRAATAVPTGWLECDGTAVSRTTYAALFAVVGTTWGVGDGSTTFNLPNQSRRTIMGKGGSGTATIGNAVGNTGGAEEYTLVANDLPAHTHASRAGSVAGGGIGAVGGVDFTAALAGNNTGNNTTTNTPVNHIQPSCIMMMCIKT